MITFGAVLFAISVAFPVVASMGQQDMLPSWIGFFDVSLALVLVIMAMLIDAVARGKISSHVIQLSYRFYRVAATLPLLLLVVFFLVGDQIKWNVLLPGLAWRAWLLLYILPSGLAVRYMSEEKPGHSSDIGQETVDVEKTK